MVTLCTIPHLQSQDPSEAGQARKALALGGLIPSSTLGTPLDIIGLELGPKS